MRLDKFVAHGLNVARSQARSLIKSRKIKINSKVVVDNAQKIGEGDQVYYQDQLIHIANKRYIALNKPAGYLCSSEDEVYPSALKLVDRADRRKLHFGGRLDVDTTGLVLLSNDGQWTHRVTSPRKRCAKTYQVTLAETITDHQIEQLASGVMLKGEQQQTLAAQVKLINVREIQLIIVEGRYHQVKRMLAAVGNHVVALSRLQIGSIDLQGLEAGQWRELTRSEVDQF